MLHVGIAAFHGTGLSSLFLRKDYKLKNRQSGQKKLTMMAARPSVLKN